MARRQSARIRHWHSHRPDGKRYEGQWRAGCWSEVLAERAGLGSGRPWERLGLHAASNRRYAGLRHMRENPC